MLRVWLYPTLLRNAVKPTLRRRCWLSRAPRMRGVLPCQTVMVAAVSEGRLAVVIPQGGQRTQGYDLCAA